MRRYIFFIIDHKESHRFIFFIQSVGVIIGYVKSNDFYTLLLAEFQT